MDAQAEKSFRMFVDNRSPALLRTATLLNGGDVHAAEDLLQSALLKAASRWNRIEDPEAYLRQILYRQQISRWRLRRRQREVTVSEPPEVPLAADQHGQSDLRLLVRHALARLTTRQRTVLVLRYFEDLPEAEVARLLGCTVGTVRSTTHRSLAKLRSLAPELSALDAARAPETPHRLNSLEATP